jgi:hypothetical protein
VTARADSGVAAIRISARQLAIRRARGEDTRLHAAALASLAAQVVEAICGEEPPDELPDTAFISSAESTLGEAIDALLRARVALRRSR